MICIVFVCNDTYIRQTLISIVSVWKQNSDAKIYLIGDDISEKNDQLIEMVSEKYKKQIHRLELQQVLPEMNLDEKDRRPHTIYAKLFLDQVLEEDRVLYLDSDVIVHGSLDELFERDMREETAAGVLMPYSSKLKNSMGIAAGSPYICDGVVLINLDLWRKTHKSQQCLRYIQECNGIPTMLSEGTLNRVCQGSIGILKPKFNLMPSMLMYQLDEIKKLFRADRYYVKEEDMKEAVQSPAIIHYMNELYNRPWQEPCEHPMRDVYRILEKEIFGENRMDHIPLSRHTRMTVWLRRHLPFGVFAAIYHVKNRI